MDGAIKILEAKGKTRAYYDEARVASKSVIEVSDEILKHHRALFRKDHVFQRMAKVMQELVSELELIELESIDDTQDHLYRIVKDHRKAKAAKLKKESSR